MFASQENGAPRKHFQKPNILRRKPNVMRNKHDENSVTRRPNLVNESSVNEVKYNIVEEEKYIVNTTCDQQWQYFNIDTVNCLDNSIKFLTNVDVINDNIMLFEQNEEIDNKDTQGPSTLNVESFINDGTLIQDSSNFNIDDSNINKDVETDINNKQCLGLLGNHFSEAMNDSDGSQINNIIDEKIYESNIGITAVPPHAVSLLNNTSVQDTETKPVYNVYNTVSPRTVKFKCDEPNCNKGFWSEARLQTHKNRHRKPNADVQVNVTCPAKKTDEDGTETDCGRTFSTKAELLAHMSENHTLEDAPYTCSRCGRRFFWSGGARTHAVRGCGRVFACEWAGCSRVFRQPCRLREHARAHTGQRPYACTHPNCDWSFRSASKLVRHMRRHTGERRHACEQCGRAFLRREHLRDHRARHLAPPAPAPAPPHGSDTTLTDANLLCLRVKNVHRKEGDERTPVANERGQRAAKAKNDMQPFQPALQYVSSEIDLASKTAAKSSGKETGESWVIELMQDIGQMPRDDVAGCNEMVTQCDVTPEASDVTPDSCDVTSEACDVTQDSCDITSDACDVTPDSNEFCRSARTHCTWPLQRMQPQYVIEDEMQSEQPDGSESNIYTVRSDLFLHGNVLINEDSEFNVNRESNSRGSELASMETRGTQLDTLNLIDAHPTIDLMQDELMYSDAAVDESSFRVFLLNGDELT